MYKRVANNLWPLLIYLLRFLILGAVKIFEHVKVFSPPFNPTGKIQNLSAYITVVYPSSLGLQSNKYIILISMCNTRPS